MPATPRIETPKSRITPAPENAGKVLSIDLDDGHVALQWSGAGRPRVSVERCGAFTLVHFDLPPGPLGDYHLDVTRPALDIQRSWVGSVDCWRGSELVSVALNYSFQSAANLNLPVLCDYTRDGRSRGVIGLLDHEPVTRIARRTRIWDTAQDRPPMQSLVTRFSRSRPAGGFRETVLLHNSRVHFAAAVREFLDFCRARRGLRPLPAPDWAREPVWCSWYSHLYLLTQRDVERQIPHLTRLGLRTVLIDASWFKPAHKALHWVWGDYEVERSFFPDLAGLSRRLHDEGLKLMLWCSPLYVGEQARKRRQMARHCTLEKGARSDRLCPFLPESRAHARAVVARLMADYALDGLKIDFMDRVDPPCADPAHDHADGNFGAAMTAFMREIRDGILGVNPDAAIEYRISYSTLASLPFANCHRGNDSPYDADYVRRENLFLRLFCAAPSAVWSDYAYWHPAESPRNIGLMLDTQSFSGGVPTLSVDLAGCPESVRRVIARRLAFYRRHREALAGAELVVHSADSVFSAASLQNRATGDAFVLLAGQHIPACLTLAPGLRRAWVLNASAEPRGRLTLRSGPLAHTLSLTGPGPHPMAF
jgi:hypothetical protein